MAKKGPRQIFGLTCKLCNRRNYVTERNKANTQAKLKLKKYCLKCRQHTLHQETAKLK